MSQIEVVTAAIEEMAGRLSGISPETTEFHGQVTTHATAAANTPAHAAMSSNAPPINVRESGTEKPSTDAPDRKYVAMFEVSAQGFDKGLTCAAMRRRDF